DLAMAKNGLRRLDPELPPDRGRGGMSELMRMPPMALPPRLQLGALIVREILPGDRRQLGVAESRVACPRDRSAVGVNGVVVMHWLPASTLLFLGLVRLMRRPELGFPLGAALGCLFGHGALGREEIAGNVEGQERPDDLLRLGT